MHKQTVLLALTFKLPKAQRVKHQRQHRRCECDEGDDAVGRRACAAAHVVTFPCVDDRPLFLCVAETCKLENYANVLNLTYYAIAAARTYTIPTDRL